MKKNGNSFTNRIIVGLVLSVLLTFSLITQAAINFSVLHDFKGPDGGVPNGLLAQGRDSWLYGTTKVGFGSAGTAGGVAFKIKPDGTSYTILHKFISGSGEGYLPQGGLTLGREGDFYGVTTGGAKQPDSSVSSTAGAIFKMTPNGVTSTLHTFSSAKLTEPKRAVSAPIVGPDGNLYGTTVNGGNSKVGIIYRLNPTNKQFTILYHFKSDHIDGINPEAPLTLGKDGFLYGTTSFGGRVSVVPDVSNFGTVFKINPNGTGYKVIYNFDYTHGGRPRGPVMQGVDGNFYGTTEVASLTRIGTVFKLTPQGALTTLKYFDLSGAFPNGNGPRSGLVQGSDGNIYGTTDRGGIKVSNGCGVIFKLTPQGAYSVIHQMNNTIDGCFDQALPGIYSSINLHANGMIFGVAAVGGPTAPAINDKVGTLLKLNTGAIGFVKPVIEMAKAGTVIDLLGDWSGTLTKVTFNNINTVFAKVSDTHARATVPVGATTGPIIVFKGTKQIKSLKNFVVLP